MLADHLDLMLPARGLDQNLHLPAGWRLSLLEFIAVELPVWRDDPRRPVETAETSLTTRLCAHMNSATRKSNGWDFLQFRIEEPDEVASGRKLDLVAAPSAAIIWIEGREYTQYTALVPIECKRLPIPANKSRDEREYLYSTLSSTGGIQRFKTGHHGAAQSVGAMIGYIQSQDVEYWVSKVQGWLENLVDAKIDGWAHDDQLSVTRRDDVAGLASLESCHRRKGGLSDIRLQHLWIQMNPSEQSQKIVDLTLDV